MLPALAAPAVAGDVIKTAKEALNTGMIGRRTTTTYHYAKKDIVEEDSFTFRLWELAFAGLVALAGTAYYQHQESAKGQDLDLKWWEVAVPITLLGRLK